MFNTVLKELHGMYCSKHDRLQWSGTDILIGRGLPIDGRTVMSDVQHLGYTTPISRALRASKAYRTTELREELEYIGIVMYPS
jgi:hypothetical protein